MATMQVRELAAKVGFTEGPIWTGDRLLVTSISRGKLYEIPLDGGDPLEVAEPGGGPNGLALGPDGAVYIAQNGGHVITELAEPVVPPGIQRWDGTTVEYVATEGLQAPNDLAFAPDGSLWFSDPYPRLDRAAPTPGKVWRLEPAGGRLELMVDWALQPNGVAISPAGDALYLVETVLKRIDRLPLTADGCGPSEPFLTLERGEQDGIAFDVEGNLYMACHHDDDAINVCDRDGNVTERIELDGCFPTNVCFAGPDLTTLVITAPKGGRVLAVEREIPGVPLPVRP
jgi:gluconolactonase